MFSKDEFLTRVLEKAGSKAAMARALDQPTSRIAELFRPPTKRGRRLTMEDGMKLAETFDVWPCGTVSAELLKPILKVCLRYAPRGAWSDQDVERLAQEIEYGLELLQSVAPNHPSQDAVEVAARAIADRHRDRPA